MTYKLITLNKYEILYEENEFQYNVCTRIKRNGELVMTPLFQLTEKIIQEAPSLPVIVCGTSLQKTTRQNILEKLNAYKKQKKYVRFIHDNKESIGWIQERTKGDYIVRLIHPSLNDSKIETVIVAQDLCCLIPSSFIERYKRTTNEYNIGN